MTAGPAARAAPGVPAIDFGALDPSVPIAESKTLQKAVGLFMENGVLVVENAFDPDFIRALDAEFRETYGAYFEDRIYDDALEVGHRRTMVTIALQGGFADPAFYAPEKLMPMLEFLLGRKLILAGLGCVVSLPGARDQHVHRDYNNIYDPGFAYPGLESVIARGPPYAITVGIPLAPMTAETGGTRFWPGTHLTTATRTDPGLGPGAAVTAGRGACVLFDYRVLHSGIANRSETVRPLVYNIYTRPWFRDPVNYEKQPPLVVTEAQLAAVPARHRGLFAWAAPGGPGTARG